MRCLEQCPAHRKHSTQVTDHNNENLSLQRWGTDRQGQGNSDYLSTGWFNGPHFQELGGELLCASTVGNKKEF